MQFIPSISFFSAPFVKRAGWLWLLAGCSIIMQAQNSVNATDQPGKWDYQYYTESSKGGYRSETNYELTPDQLSAFKKKISEVAEYLHQNPVAKNPVGFEPTVRGSVFTEMYEYKKNPARWKLLPPEAEIILQFCPLYKNLKTGLVSKGCIEVSHLDVLLNNLKSTAGGYNTYTKGNESFIVFESLVPYKTFGPGVTAYTNGTVILSNPDKPYWIPLTIREYFALELNFYEEQAVKDGNTFVLDYVKKDYAAFTPQELDMTAYVGAQTNSSMILATSRPTDRTWMKLNPDYFDKSLPRSAVQLITIHTLQDALLPGQPQAYENTDYGFHFQYTRQLDFKDMSRLLDVPKH